MRKYIKELVILVIQLFMFYIFPLFAGPTDAMGMVFLIILVTFLLSTTMGSISCEKVKYLYPIVIAIIFIPSVYLHYNDSALIHSVWYFVVSTIGLVMGMLIRKLIYRKQQMSMELTTDLLDSNDANQLFIALCVVINIYTERMIDYEKKYQMCLEDAQ